MATVANAVGVALRQVGLKAPGHSAHPERIWTPTPATSVGDATADADEPAP
jgi:hypothetical protein